VHSILAENRETSIGKEGNGETAQTVMQGQSRTGNANQEDVNKLKGGGIIFKLRIVFQGTEPERGGGPKRALPV